MIGVSGDQSLIKRDRILELHGWLIVRFRGDNQAASVAALQHGGTRLLKHRINILGAVRRLADGQPKRTAELSVQSAGQFLQDFGRFAGIVVGNWVDEGKGIGREAMQRRARMELLNDMLQRNGAQEGIAEAVLRIGKIHAAIYDDISLREVLSPVRMEPRRAVEQKHCGVPVQRFMERIQLRQRLAARAGQDIDAFGDESILALSLMDGDTAFFHLLHDFNQRRILAQRHPVGKNDRNDERCKNGQDEEEDDLADHIEYAQHRKG